MAHDNDASNDGRTVTDKLGRRRFIRTTGAGAAMAGLAGCIPDSDGQGTPTPDDDGTPTPTGPETPPPPEGSLTIGLLAPLSGPTAVLGSGAARAAGMATAEINAGEGVMGQEIEVVNADTQNSPGTAQSETERLVNEENVDVLMGTFASESTQTILPFTAQEGIPLIVTGSAAPTTVTDFVGSDYERYKNLFRTGPINSIYQARGFAGYADYLSARHGWNTFGFVADRASWTTPFDQRLPSLLEDKGYTVPYTEQISIETDNYSPILNSLVEAEVEGVFRFFAHQTAANMVGEWVQRRLPFGIEGINVWSQMPSWFEQLQGAAIFTSTSQSGAGGVAPVTEKTVPFTEAYREQFGEAENPPRGHPMYMGFNTYDAIHFYRQAVESAGTWDYDNFLDDIVDAMLSETMVGSTQTIDLMGPDGEFPHDVKAETEASGTLGLSITQWQQEGALECVYPQSYSTADHLAPSWM